MPIVPIDWDLDLLGNLQSYGWEGESLSAFTLSLGQGSALGIIGTSFTTQDTGVTPGAGTGSGVGISLPDSSELASKLQINLTARFGQSGDELPNLCLAIADMVVDKMQLASLTSSHTPVSIGSGTVDSISVVGTLITSSILLLGLAFVGEKFLDIAEALGEEIEAFINDEGEGSVVISGSPPLPIPIPGSGTGSGVLS